MRLIILLFQSSNEYVRSMLTDIMRARGPGSGMNHLNRVTDCRAKKNPPVRVFSLIARASADGETEITWKCLQHKRRQTSFGRCHSHPQRHHLRHWCR